jgi:16S rRNA A1518/A1519 N6-dimethyltransferase RsmA/KsgA/DIM1 with predicted DNA glycosylase/AP lyase activity
MILMFQREVVQRITAKIGNSERGFLTVLVEAYLESEKLFDVPPNAFSPAPKVWSSVVRLKPKIDIEIENEKLFRQIVSAGFRQKRKTIANNLKSEFENLKRVLGECGVDRQRRAETLTLDEWICLAKRKAGDEIYSFNRPLFVSFDYFKSTFRGKSSETTIETPIVPKIKASDHVIGNLPPKASFR